jgi:hypothetical protein
MPAGPTITEFQAFTKTTYSGDDLTQLTSVMSTVTSMVSSYTRGQGFSDGAPSDDLKGVILSATVRMLGALKLPVGIKSDSMGPFATQFDTSGFGWTVAEKLVLDRYRVKAM